MVQLQPSPTIRSAHGMVASIDHLASGAGVEMLRHGGSAVDAAIATSAVLAVTSQHLCGLGGDLWALVHPGPGHEPVVLNASGRAGSGADPDRLRAAGHTQIPPLGDIAAVPVPGCVDGWIALHQRFGVLPLDQILAPAIAAADQGFPPSPSLLAAWPRVSHLPEAADYLGLSPRRLVRRPGVARTLRAIAASGRDAFYSGEFGQGLLEVGGGEYTAGDLDQVQADWTAPIEAEAWGHRLWSAGPNSQGYLTLASAWMASRLDLPADPDDPSWAHLLIEASRQAGHDRLEVLHEHADPRALLDPERLAAGLAAIDRDHAGSLDAPAAAGDTIALCTVDQARQGVSLIQSNAGGWGSGLVVPGVRIFLHNRGQGFSLVPGHPAEYGPHRRPPHTLCPTLVTGPDGQLRAVLGTMGGDAQPQILLQLVARLLGEAGRNGTRDPGGPGRDGPDPGEMVAAGRWALGAPLGSDGQPVGDGFGTWTRGGQVAVRIEGQAPASWAPALAALGHDVVEDPAWSSAFGHAHLIAVGPDVLAGGSDPRPRSGAVQGW